MARIDAAKEELFNLRFQLATGQLDNTRVRLRGVQDATVRAGGDASCVDALERDGEREQQ